MFTLQTCFKPLKTFSKSRPRIRPLEAGMTKFCYALSVAKLGDLTYTSTTYQLHCRLHCLRLTYDLPAQCGILSTSSLMPIICHWQFCDLLWYKFRYLIPTHRWPSNVLVMWSRRSANERPFMYSQKWNCTASLFLKQTYNVLSPISYTRISARDLYISRIRLYILLQPNMCDRSWEYINRSQTHECGNWDWCRALPKKRNT
jgi:hypothetical protein